MKVKIVARQESLMNRFQELCPNNKTKIMSVNHIKSFVSVGVLAFSVQTFAQRPDRPNILCILADDLGYGDLSCQGGKDVHTPNIDQIFNGGIRFTNFYANSTVSSPSRAALLTGRYPDLVGVPGVIRTHEDDSWGYLSPDAVLLPEVLKTAGYKSAIIGKWHLGLESPNTPNEKGFDCFKGFLGDMMDDYYTHLRFGNNYMRYNHQIINTKGVHATDLFSDWAVAYLNEQKEQKEPFFLYLAYNAPHTPIQPPKEWEEKVKKRELDISKVRAKLVALIEHLDDGVGRVLAALDKNGMMENTLIIFVSDNGGQSDAGANNGIFRGGKQDMYEGGIRVSGGMFWKNKIKAGSITGNFAMLFDLFPTICEAVGATIPHPIDGISLMSTLTGQDQITDNRTVFWVRREGNMRYGGKDYYAARNGNYKILQNTPWEPVQFFDLAADPEEKNPLNPAGALRDTYRQLFNSQMEHIRRAGAVPWQKSHQ
jgi:arylsulfatase A-like enzyme